MNNSNKKIIEEIITNYGDSLTGIEDLYGDGYNDLSKLFYLINKRWIHWLDNNPENAVREDEVLFRRKIYPVLKKIIPLVMKGYNQTIENRNTLNDPNSRITDEGIVLPEKPVIFVANHAFSYDVPASVVAANRHAYIYCGSLPMAYNTIEGLSSGMLGHIMVNRKVRDSRRASIEKGKRVLDLGTDLLICPEGGWNKTSEKPMLDLWNGFYKLSCSGNYDVVPIIHYERDMDVINKKNIIHTVVDDPIPLYELSEKEAIQYLRDLMASWLYKMMEQYGQSTRERETIGFSSSNEAWENKLEGRMELVKRYDFETERNANYWPNKNNSPENVFTPIANLRNVTPNNIKTVQAAKELVRTRKKEDYQRNF